MKKIIKLTLVFFLMSCDQSPPAKITSNELAGTSIKKSSNNDNKDTKNNNSIVGLWRGILESPGGELPFGIEINKDNNNYIAKILNGKERADTSSVQIQGHQLNINFDWFDARISATINDDFTQLIGHWSKTASGQNKTSSLPFKAQKGYEYRFSPPTITQQKQTVHSNAYPNIKGNWEVIFEDEDGQSQAVAEFEQNENKVTGTFLTPTGDYRYLAGSIINNTLYLSTFDGAHAFLFNAKIDNDEILEGNFWSRDSYHATFSGRLSDDTNSFLPSSWDMNSITSADNSVSFSFNDINGSKVQLSDEKFQNKPVLINLFGTWCPNCNDEAPVLAEFYNKYNPQGLQIVGLAFEFTEDPIRDTEQLKKFKKRHGINYPLLLAGGNDKSKATKILGFLDEVKSYPTTIFLDRNHKVVKIHTGFSGPGTGEHYINLVKELENEIKNIL